MPTTTNTTGQVSPLVQNLTWERGTPFPAIQDLFVQSTNAEFVEVDIQFIGTSLSWITVAGYSGNNFYINDFSIAATLELNLESLELLIYNSYKAVFHFRMAKFEGADKLVDVEINLSISGVTGIQTDKSIYDLVYNRANNTLSGDALVSILNNTGALLLKFWQNGNLFAAAENFTDSFTLLENSGNPLATNPALPTTGTVNIPAKILKQTGEFVSGFNINLLVIDGGISVEPQSLTYEVFKGTEKSQTLSVVNPLGLSFNITQYPFWINLDSTSGSTTKTITATTATSGTAEGIYSGIIKFEYDGKFIDIPVTLDLKTFISIDGSEDFCLDLPEVKVSKKTPEATLVRITLKGKYIVLGVTTAFEKMYSQNYFQDKVLFGLGEKLHRHFPRIKKHFFDDDEVILMQQIEASIKVEELDVNRNLLFEQTVSGIKLFPGKRPVGYPFLTNTVFRKKNDKAIIFSSSVTGAAITLNKITEEALPNPLVLGTTSISFYDFPKVYQPAHLQWENQNLVPEWFTLTGDYTITPEFNHIYARNIFNAQNEKYDVSEIQTLNISTGLIMAKERPLIKEMIRSKLSFIKIGDNIYRCFNITKKMTSQDSTEELLSNDLEFLIVEQ